MRGDVRQAAAETGRSPILEFIPETSPHAAVAAASTVAPGNALSEFVAEPVQENSDADPVPAVHVPESRQSAPTRHPPAASLPRGLRWRLRAISLAVAGIVLLVSLIRNPFSVEGPAAVLPSSTARHLSFEAPQALSPPLPPAARLSAPDGSSATASRVMRPAPVRPAPLPTGAPVGRADGRFRGDLVVVSTPPGARVRLNGRDVGTTPLAIGDLPSGSAALSLRLDGHEAWSASIRVVADTLTRVSADLRPAGR